MAGGRHSNPGDESRAAHLLAVRPTCNMGRVEGLKPAIQRQPGPIGGVSGKQRVWPHPTHEAFINSNGNGPYEPLWASAGSLGHWAAPQEQLINTKIPVPCGIVSTSEIF